MKPLCLLSASIHPIHKPVGVKNYDFKKVASLVMEWMV